MKRESKREKQERLDKLISKIGLYYLLKLFVDKNNKIEDIRHHLAEELNALVDEKDLKYIGKEYL